MPYELLNNNQVTPARLFAFLRLAARLKNPQKETLLNLLQPAALLTGKRGEDEEDNETTTTRSSGDNILLAAKHCDLIRDTSDNTLIVSEQVEANLGSIEQFRRFMQGLIWNMTFPEQNNYLFNLYSAWYIVQNERVFQFEEKDFETRFNNELFKDAAQRMFNMTKYPGWRMWATFLGVGWLTRSGINIGNREIIAPDSSFRLHGVLPALFARAGKRELSFRHFMGELANDCPELDGGELFQQCQAASWDSEVASRYLSLALSTGLRQLHYAGVINLVRRADASDIWPLYPAEGHDQNLKEVTHIRILEGHDGK